MSMKKTDIEKSKAIKLREGVQKAPVPARFGVVSTAVPDRREQRRLDQAAGLVPFACKLKDELVQRLRALAEQEGGDLNALTERLIRAGLSAEGVRVPAAKKSSAAKPVASKAAATLPVVKTSAKPAAAPKAPAKKAATRSVAQPAVKPAVAKKTVAKKAATSQAVVAKKATATKVPAKKVPSQKATPAKAKKA